MKKNFINFEKIKKKLPICLIKEGELFDFINGVNKDLDNAKNLDELSQSLFLENFLEKHNENLIYKSVLGDYRARETGVQLQGFDYLKTKYEEVKDIIKNYLKKEYPIKTSLSQEVWKTVALKSVNELKSKYGFQNVVIFEPFEWHEVANWAMKLSNSIETTNKNLGLDDKAASIDGKLHLMYLQANCLQDYAGMYSQLKDLNFILIKEQFSDDMTQVWQHEYVHALDKFAYAKLYQNNEIVRDVYSEFNFLSSLSMNIINSEFFSDIEKNLLQKTKKNMLNILGYDNEDEYMDSLGKISNMFINNFIFFVKDVLAKENITINKKDDFIKYSVMLFFSSSFGRNNNTITSQKYLQDKLPHTFKEYQNIGEIINLNQNRFQDYTKNLMMSNNAITQGGSLCLARSKIAIESMKKDLQLNNRYYSLIHELFARKCETLAQKLDVDKKDTDGYLWFENSNKKERQELINNLYMLINYVTDKDLKKENDIFNLPALTNYSIPLQNIEKVKKNKI